jgi:hypothetical protein
LDIRTAKHGSNQKDQLKKEKEKACSQQQSNSQKATRIN